MPLRSTIFQLCAPYPFFPASPLLTLFPSSLAFPDQPSASLLSVIFARSLDESSGERERENERFFCSRKRTLAPVSPFSTNLTRSRGFELIRPLAGGRTEERRIGAAMSNNPVDGYKDSMQGVSVQAGYDTDALVGGRRAISRVWSEKREEEWIRSTIS